MVGVDQGASENEMVAFGLVVLAVVAIVAVVGATRLVRPAVNRIADLDVGALVTEFSNGNDRWLARRRDAPSS